MWLENSEVRAENFCRGIERKLMRVEIREMVACFLKGEKE